MGSPFAPLHILRATPLKSRDAHSRLRSSYVTEIWSPRCSDASGNLPKRCRIRGFRVRGCPQQRPQPKPYTPRAKTLNQNYPKPESLNLYRPRKPIIALLCDPARTPKTTPKAAKELDRSLHESPHGRTVLGGPFPIGPPLKA